MKYTLIYFGINLLTVLYPIYLIFRNRNFLKKNPDFYYKNREWGKKVIESYTESVIVMIFAGIFMVLIIYFGFVISFLGMALEFITDKIILPIAGYLEELTYKIMHPKFLKKLKIYKKLFKIIEYFFKIKK